MKLNVVPHLDADVRHTSCPRAMVGRRRQNRQVRGHARRLLVVHVESTGGTTRRVSGGGEKAVAAMVAPSAATGATVLATDRHR